MNNIWLEYPRDPTHLGRSEMIRAWLNYQVPSKDLETLIKLSRVSETCMLASFEIPKKKARKSRK